MGESKRNLSVSPRSVNDKYFQRPQAGRMPEMLPPGTPLRAAMKPHHPNRGLRDGMTIDNERGTHDHRPSEDRGPTTGTSAARTCAKINKHH